MAKVNPYTPGAGSMPAYLAGRDDIINDATKIMDTVINGYPERSVIYYGLRGVGKTVLLNKLEEIADEKAILFEHVEVKEKGNFIQQLTSITAKIIKEMSFSKKAANLAKDFAAKAAMALRNLKMTYDPSGGSITVGIEGMENIDEIINTESLLEDKLTDLFVELGNVAIKTENTICLFIDEMQYMKKDTLEALSCAMHKVSQKRLPIVIFGAGLPRVAKEFGDAKSYTERLFDFIEIGALPDKDARLAIEKPADSLGKKYDTESTNKIFQITDGYPYFIQEFCKIIWNKAEDMNESNISLKLVKSVVEEFYAKLDESFFKIRYDRCTDSEKEFIFAMGKCDKLPCSIKNVAQIMNKEVNQISMIRATLISKGIIYSTKHGEIDFTVPQFDNFLSRMTSH